MASIRDLVRCLVRMARVCGLDMPPKDDVNRAVRTIDDAQRRVMCRMVDAVCPPPPEATKGLTCGPATLEEALTYDVQSSWFYTLCVNIRELAARGYLELALSTPAHAPHSFDVRAMLHSVEHESHPRTVNSVLEALLALGRASYLSKRERVTTTLVVARRLDKYAGTGHLPETSLTLAANDLLIWLIKQDPESRVMVMDRPLTMALFSASAGAISGPQSSTEVSCLRAWAIERVRRLTIGAAVILRMLTGKKCATCGVLRTPERHLHRCDRCRSVYYCNQECQLVGWKNDMHKAVCKSLAHEHEHEHAAHM
jgi:hypothetical protein